ncbi:MAG: hypothetical protein KJ698_08980 [Actinobacteria bacterium]|nr:hypothetical protein [Actinomycetota bacterium]MBU1493361.1 hypothetical protein [Actinomycetota bacterium]
MTKAAYLRMYLPAEQVGYFPEHVPAADSRRVLTRGTFGVWGEAPRNDAFITAHLGRRFVCPRLPRLRMLEGILAFRTAYPGLTASLLVPARVAEAAVRELQRIQAAGATRSHILTSPWHVPLRWFAAFAPHEREIVDEGGRGISIRYRTLQGDALRRLRRVVDVLDEAGFEEDVVEQLTDVIAWMEGFPPDAMVELDYDEVAELFPEGALIFDETANDISVCIDALADGDVEAAGEAYAAAVSRWSDVRSIAHAN